MKIFGKEIPRRKAFLKFTEIRNQRQRGSHWVELIISVVNPQLLISMTILVSLKLTQVGYHFPFWLLLGLLTMGGILLEVLKWLVGRQDYKKWKLWELETEWLAKNKVVAPFNVDMMKTLRKICKKLGIEDEFRDINRKDD